MIRVFGLTTATLAILMTSLTTGAAQSRGRTSVSTASKGRSADDWCGDGWSSDRNSYCEVRQETISGVNPVEVEGRNGGIRVNGWDRGDILVRSRIVGSAETEAEARRLVSGVRIETAGGHVHADGPQTSGEQHWGVSFELMVPRRAFLTLNTHNGGISIDDFNGSAEFQTQNGGVSLRNVGGTIRGTTTNGGLNVDLSGDHWDGGGLDIQTHNGGIRIAMPEGYSAELEAGTTHGGVNIDFPVTVQGRIGRHINATLGAGGAKLKVMTTNGGVSIRRK